MTEEIKQSSEEIKKSVEEIRKSPDKVSLEDKGEVKLSVDE